MELLVSEIGGDATDERDRGVFSWCTGFFDTQGVIDKFVILMGR